MKRTPKPAWLAKFFETHIHSCELQDFFNIKHGAVAESNNIVAAAANEIFNYQFVRLLSSTASRLMIPL